MKKILLFSIFIFFTAATPAHAIDFCPFGQFGTLCELSPNDNTNIVGNIITILLIASIIAAIVFLILGGLRWILAGGDKAKIDSARSTITGAIIGLIISFLAFAIVSFVNYVFGINSPNGTIFQLPRIYSNPDTARTGSSGGIGNTKPVCSILCDGYTGAERGACITRERNSGNCI